ncbi:MAG: hypothetical protein ACRDI2_14795 [Chloroflexota bacterium]
MTVIDAELFVQAQDVEGDREALLEETLRQVPGVRFVSPRSHDDPTAAACVQIAFDPTLTNPVAIKEVLARHGFTVLLARESDSADESQPAPPSA